MTNLPAALVAPLCFPFLLWKMFSVTRKDYHRSISPVYKYVFSSDCTWKQAMRKYIKKMCLNLSTGVPWVNPSLPSVFHIAVLLSEFVSRVGGRDQSRKGCISTAYHLSMILTKFGFSIQYRDGFFHSLASLLEISSNISSHLLLHLRVNNVFVLPETHRTFKQNWAPVFYSAIIV